MAGLRRVRLRLAGLLLQATRVAGASRLGLDFSTGESIAMLLPPELGLDAYPGLVSGLKRVVQTVLALGNAPRTAVANIKDSPIRSFEGKTALEMIAADRTDDVVAYLESLSADGSAKFWRSQSDYAAHLQLDWTRSPQPSPAFCEADEDHCLRWVGSVR